MEKLFFLCFLISTMFLSSLAIAEENAPFKVKDLEIEKCKTRIDLQLVKRGPDVPEYDEGYYQIVFFDRKRKFELKRADTVVYKDNFDQQQSKCKITPVFERKDGLIWILAGKDGRPYGSSLVGVLYSPEKKKIIADFSGKNFQKISFFADELTYESVIQRSDLGGGMIQFKGASHTCTESEQPLIHTVSHKNDSINDRFDLEKTYQRSPFKRFFKSSKDFESYFDLANGEDNKKNKRWVYLLDNKNAPNCIIAARLGTSRDCTDLDSKDVICLKN